MDWIEVSVSTTTQAADTVSGVLISCGARGTQILDRLDVPDRDDGTGFGELYGDELKLALPEDVAVKAWFASAEEARSAGQAITALSGLPGLDYGSLSFSIAQVQDEDWAENWKKYYKPQRVGKRLVIRPVWEEYEERPGDLVISMDPGMAFGTGTHETTRLCMEMIERHFKGGRALDIGTGSGILAIALAKLGAKEVTAVDIDPIAVKAAGENAARNGLADTIHVVEGDLARDIGGRFDFICANILADIIISLSPAVPLLLAPGGAFLASGIIKDREQDVLGALAGLGFALMARREEGEWVALLFEVKDA